MIDIIFSESSKAISPTLARKLFMMAKEYDDVIDFTIGDPDIVTDKEICKAAYNASLNGHTRYSANAGIPELRNTIAKRLNEDYNTDFNLDNIAITVGAMEALYLSLMALINKNDEVIILAPYWIQYENMVKILNGKPIVIDKFTNKDSFEIDLEKLKRAISHKTKAIIINSPNNPSGYVYSAQFLKEIADIACKNDICIIADEVYNTLVYDEKYVSVLDICNKDNVILINSCSKTFAMTGWRVGYLAANSDFIKVIIKLQQNVANCASTPSQYAALEAFEKFDYYSSLVKDEFEKRRDVLVKELKNIELLKFKIPKGTFYCFIDISKTNMKSEEFAFSLLKEKQVAVIPGIAYGSSFDNYIRLAFTLEEEKIILGINRLKEFLNSI